MELNTYLQSLWLAWAEYDNVIITHPVPDNKKTAEAYRMRDYIGYLIDTAPIKK